MRLRLPLSALALLVFAGGLTACEGIVLPTATEGPPVTATLPLPPPTPTATFGLYIGIGGYPLVTTRDVGTIPAGVRVRVSHTYFDGTDTIYVIVAEDELTTADVREDQITFAPDVTPGAFPSDSIYQAYIGMGYMFITTERVGDIPAGARVRISHATMHYDAWFYFIVAEDETLTAEVRDHQITFAPDVTPGPTPMATYDAYIGMGYDLITIEQVSDIPAGARVRISHASFTGTEWLYVILTEDDLLIAEARENQLSLAPGVPTVAPGATCPIPTPAAGLSTYLGMDYLLITTEQVGDIPAGARVRIAYGQLTDDGWLYGIVVTGDGTLAAEAREDQLAFAPDIPTPDPGALPPGPTPTASHNASIGGGYSMITTEQVGFIPAGTRVRITYARFTGEEWRYGITTEDERFIAEVRDHQLAPAPGVTPDPTANAPTPTPTPQPGGCAHTWFFHNPPDVCPLAPPLNSTAAAQYFKHGLMIWVDALDQIFVMFDEDALDESGVSFTGWLSRDDPWQPGMPEADPEIVPPSGYYQPVRGFGMVWRGEGVPWWPGDSVDELLGWALEPEFGFDTSYQCDDNQSTPGIPHTNCYLLDPQGRVIELNIFGGWHTLAEPAG